MYALEAVALTNSLLEKLDGVQRCMLRRMVGWICYEEDTWEERGHRMKMRLQTALSLHPVTDWSGKWGHRRQNLKDNMHIAPRWTRASYEWNPQACGVHNNHIPYRNVGRPRMQW